MKPLIWTGDLNVCHKDIDVTHPRFFATQKPEGRKGKPPEPPPSDPNDFGQPGEFIVINFHILVGNFTYAVCAIMQVSRPMSVSALTTSCARAAWLTRTDVSTGM